jgi:hypothetical protein
MPEENTANLSYETAVPAPVRVFLSSNETIGKRLSIFDDNGVAALDVIKVGRLLNRIYDKEVALNSFYDEIVKIFPGKEQMAKKLVLDLAGNELFAVSDYLGDVAGLIKSLGGDPSSYPAQKITIREITPTEVVTEVLHENPVNVPAFLEHRLREILESRVRNVRKDAETIQRLTRAEKIGGVEMDEEEAQTLVEKLVSKIAGIKIAPDAPTEITPSAASYPQTDEEMVASGEVLPQPEQGAVNIPVAKSSAPVVAPVARPASSDRKGDSFMPADEHEADAIRARVLPNIMTQELFDLGREITNATDLIASAYGKNLTPELSARLKAVVESRLKGVRDAAETADLLSRPVATGGVGLGPVLAGALADELKKYDQDIHGQREVSLKKEKESFVKDSVAMTYAKDESRKSGEQEELDRMYSALTGSKKKRMPVSEIPNANNQTPSKVKNSNIQNSTPAPASLYLYKPPTAAPMQPLSQQPGGRMRDIRPAVARLTGPVEELKSMTLTDFRRLSSDPAEACRKLLDKLDLLEERSFGQRIEGAKAWRESEVYKLYLQIITASFSSGKQVPAIIADAMAVNQPTLTEHEVHAIMDMNRNLKA